MKDNFTWELHNITNAVSSQSEDKRILPPKLKVRLS